MCHHLCHWRNVQGHAKKKVLNSVTIRIHPTPDSEVIYKKPK